MQSAPLTEVRLSATAACLELGAGLVEARGKAEATVARVDRQKAGIKGAAQAGKAKVLAKQAQTARAAAKLVSAVIVLNIFFMECCMRRITSHRGLHGLCCL
jgi:hypothetical protein